MAREYAVCIRGERDSAIMRGDAENAAQLLCWDLHRAGTFGLAGRGLRERGRAGGVESHIAFNLLHGLVNVSV